MTDLPNSRCPECGYMLDAATDPFGDAVPKSGDFSICIKCLSFLRFDHRLRLKLIPNAEFRELPEEFRAKLHRMRRVMGEIDRA